MKIETLQLTEIVEASNIITKVFDELIAADYIKTGINLFYNVISEQSIRERLLTGSLINVAKIDNKIVGYIEIQGINHIYLLFVKKEFQKKGIAGKLINNLLNILRENNPGLTEVTVSSAKYAVKIYEKIGFVKIADFQFKNGIISYPMSIMIR